MIDYNKIIVGSFNQTDFAEYNEVLFSAHSCAVEGNSFSVDETRELKEKGMSLKLQNKSLFEAFEILDHFKAYEFVFSDINRGMDEDFLKETHSILTQNTIKYAKGYEPGEYTRSQMAAGDTVFGDYEESIAKVPNLKSATQIAIDNANLHPLEISAMFHLHFIYLHPFPDGNGRLGRLMSNFILAKFEKPHVIVTAKDKSQYINSLKQSHKHKDVSILTAFFAENSINRMQDEIDQKTTASQNFELDFNKTKDNTSNFSKLQ